jgi:cytochrome c biogenesis protein CcdA
MQYGGPALFTLGAVASGTAGGALVGISGAWINAPQYARHILVAIGLIHVLAVYKNIPIRAPTSTWQVPRPWRAYGRQRFGFLFGLALGTGVITVVNSAAYYVFLVGVFSLDNVLQAALLGGSFALGRAAPLCLVSLCIARRLALRQPVVRFECLKKVSRHRRIVSDLRLASATMVASVAFRAILR